MPDATLIIIAVAIIAILIAAAWWYSMRQRTAQLQEKFGPEYRRTVAEKGDTRKAEDELTDRQRRVAKLQIRPLAADERRSFHDEWQAVQARFVDDPSASIDDADTLVGRVMEARGYPVGDFEQRAADVSVDHPIFLEHYRSAHDIALRQAEGQASTEDLRQAMVNFRALFADLLEEPRLVSSSPNTSPRVVSR
jgi:FtsZ-interacting cell division protein ZipA